MISREVETKNIPIGKVRVGMRIAIGTNTIIKIPKSRKSFPSRFEYIPAREIMK